jgi:hypothetical protein
MLILVFIAVLSTCILICMKTTQRKHLVLKQDYRAFLKRAGRSNAAEKEYYKAVCNRQEKETKAISRKPLSQKKYEHDQNQ